MKKLIWLIIIVVVIVGIVLIVNNNDVEEETGPIKIGIIGPLTGDAATLGENAVAAAEMAVDEINASGGINDRILELAVEDGQCTGNVANNAANKLINVDGVVAIIGGMCSAESSAITTLSEQAQVPLLSPASSAPSLTDAGDYFFRIYPSDAYQGVFAAEHMKNTLGINKVAVLYTNDDWGVGLQGAFIESFEGLGGEVVAVESFEKTARDL